MVDISTHKPGAVMRYNAYTLAHMECCRGTQDAVLGVDPACSKWICSDLRLW